MASSVTRHETALPSRISITRSTAAATRSEWVTTTTVRLERSSAQRLEHELLVLLVELAGRLVGEHELRAARRGGGDRDALLLAARQRRGAVRPALAEPELRERGLGGLVGVGHAGEAQRRWPRSRAPMSAGHRLSLWKTIAVSRAR